MPKVVQGSHRVVNVPVSVRDLLSGSLESSLRQERRPARVLKFLQQEADKAYTAAELARKFRTDHRTLRTVLARLYARGVVEKGGDYWYALGEEDAAHKRAFLAAARGLDSRLGPERKRDWPAVEQPDD